MSAMAINGGAQRGNPWRAAVWGTAAFVLLMPALAMQVFDDVQWDRFDFIVIGALLTLACGAYEVCTRISGNTAYRAASALAIATALLLVWANLAVGIIGSEGNPANLMYAGVLAVGAAGALMARFRASGMARALFATAGAQIAVAAIAAGTGLGYVFVPTALFAMLWIASAALFGHAARSAASH